MKKKKTKHRLITFPLHTKLNYFSYKLFWEKGKTHIAEKKKKKSTSMIFPCSAFKPQPTNSSTQS